MKNKTLTVSTTKQETIFGWMYLAFQLIALPGILSWANETMELSEAEYHFCFFVINFIAVLLIFNKYLSRSFTQVLQHPSYFIQAVILGFVAYYACSWGINKLFSWIAPGYTNANDASIAALSKGNFFLMAIGTVVLVPPVEECFYRGLIFRNLYGVSRLAAYLVSMAVFAFIHIIGHIQSYTLLQLILAFLQYLPAGLCLAWSYAKSDTVFSPIVIHALVNAWSIGLLR